MALEVVDGAKGTLRLWREFTQTGE